MGEMKNFGRKIHHWEEDKNFLEFCDQNESEDNENIIFNSQESIFRKILNFTTNITKRYKKKI